MLPQRDPPTWAEYMDLASRLARLEGAHDALVDQHEKQREAYLRENDRIDECVETLQANNKFQQTWWDAVKEWWYNA